MARYRNEISVAVEPTSLYQPLSDFLIKEGFEQCSYKGVNAWRKGLGVLTAPQFIILSNTASSIVVEAFIKYALLPGVFVGEMGINGFFGAIPKQQLKNRVITIENYVRTIGAGA